MALGLQVQSGGGDYAAVAKYDSRAGRFFRIDREQDGAGNWNSSEEDITQTFAAVMDFENIEVGWMLFAAGVAPQWDMVPVGTPMPPRPSDQHKQGFRIKMKLAKSCGGDVREFASQAKAVLGAMETLHNAYLEGVKANPGKLPVVAMTGTTAIKTSGKGQTSTNYAPVFEIRSWVDRPAELNGSAAPKAEEPAPVVKPAPATVMADADAEF